MSVDISTSERDSDNSCENRISSAPNGMRKGTLSENGSRSESNNTLTNVCIMIVVIVI